MKINSDYDFNKETFKVNGDQKLLSQAVRVFSINQRQGNADAKTRTETAGTKKKMYKQKGTGNARHSDRKAPIFVGGGTAHGPKSKNFQAVLPQKMRQLALKTALSLKHKNKKVIAVSGLEKLTGKTKELAGFVTENKIDLIVTNGVLKNVWLAGRNIKGLVVVPVAQLNIFEVLKSKIIAWDDSIGEVKKKTSKK